MQSDLFKLLLWINVRVVNNRDCLHCLGLYLSEMATFFTIDFVLINIVKKEPFISFAILIISYDKGKLLMFLLLYRKISLNIRYSFYYKSTFFIIEGFR